MLECDWAGEVLASCKEAGRRPAVGRATGFDSPGSAEGVAVRGRGVDSLLDEGDKGESEPFIEASAVLVMVEVLAALSVLAFEEPETVRFVRL